MNLRGLWDNVRSQLAANRRLALLVAAIGVVLLGLGVDLGLTHLDEQSRELRELGERRDRLEALSGSTEWFQRADDAETALASLEAGIPVVRSPGLAQAMFQGWLRERTAGMDGNVFADVGAAQVLGDEWALPGVVKVTATLTGRSHRNTVIDLLRRTESASHLIAVDAFSIPADPETGFTLTLSAYYRVDGTPEEAG